MTLKNTPYKIRNLSLAGELFPYKSEELHDVTKKYFYLS